jgi:ATP-dependent RNA helicase RhlE
VLIKQHSEDGFSQLNIAPALVAILAKLGITQPTPIQSKVIPLAASGQDVIGIAQTGTGKTLAFLLPMIQAIARQKKQGLVIVPTRELAAQIDEILHKFSHSIAINRALIIGGAAMAPQIAMLKRRPHIIIGTPGRLNDLIEQGALKLNHIGILVLDEADRMLDMGFAPQIKKIVSRLPQNRQTLIFSATIPSGITKIASQYMKNPVRVAVARSGSVAAKVNQEIYLISKNEKSRLLERLLTDFSGTVLVFSRTKYCAKRLCREVRQMGHSAAEIHSNLSLSQRRRSLSGFKTGAHRVLVATDIASRGLDVTNISLVINYDLPENAEDYVHRVGRTGRAGLIGHAISFIMPDQRFKVREIERLIKTNLRISPLPQLPDPRPKIIVPRHTQSRFHHSRQRSSQKTYLQGSRQRARARVH